MKVQGNTDFLQNLSENQSAGCFRVFFENDEWLVECAEFEEYSPSGEAGKVNEIATRIIQTLNGLYFLKSDSVDSFVYAGLFFEKEDGKRVSFIFPPTINSTSTVFPPTITVLDNDGNRIRQDSDDKNYQIINLALKDEKVAQILRLMNRDKWTFANMYKIYDIIKSDFKKSTIEKWSVGNLSLFTLTANHPKAIGDESRHGYLGQELPPISMSLEDAKKLIIKMWNEYLKRKLGLN